MSKPDLAQPLTVHSWPALESADRDRLLQRANEQIFSAELREQVSGLIEDVRNRGDVALVDALKQFDQCAITVDQLLVSEAAFAAADQAVSDEVKAALDDAIDHIKRFNERLMRDSSWREELESGLTVGEQASPIASAGLFVPSGKGSFPSTLTQIATPAVVAGVKEIAVVVPPKPGGDGAVDPAVLVAAQRLGIRNVFRANGPTGVAALAFGTETVPKCVKVLGPGSPVVQATQVMIQSYGCASLMVMGPTESLVIADGSADPELLALDLLIEAEHGPDSAVLFVTPDEDLLAAVQVVLVRRLSELPEPRASYARSALGMMGGAIVTQDLAEAATVANWYAPEHLQLAVAEADALLGQITDAGEILLGQSTPFSAANYVLGIPAALPTGRFARVHSGVSARTFTKCASLAEASPAALERLSDSIIALAEHEDFPAHALAIRERLGSVQHNDTDY